MSETLSESISQWAWLAVAFSVLLGLLALHERRQHNQRDAGLLASLGLAGALGSLFLFLGA